MGEQIISPSKPILEWIDKNIHDAFYKSMNEWFEVMPEPIKVKNPSYNIRGTRPCPKFVASPWAQSSIESVIHWKVEP